MTITCDYNLAGTDIFDMALGFQLHAHGFDSLRLNFQPKGGSNPWLKCAVPTSPI